MKVLGPDTVVMRLWDTGVKLYALPYYATANTHQDARRRAGEISARAAARAGNSPISRNRDKAVDLLVKEFPNLKPQDEREALETHAEVRVLAAHQDRRLGHDGSGDLAGADQPLCRAEAVLQRVPKLEEVMTLDILKATADSRPKIG